MKIIHSALTNVYTIARRLGATDQNAEVIAQVTVESAIALVPVFVTCMIAPSTTLLSRARRAHAATCWGFIAGAVGTPAIKEWVRDRREALVAAQAQAATGDDIVFEEAVEMLKSTEGRAVPTVAGVFRHRPS